MFEGVLHKMITENANPIEYYLQLETDFIHMNPLINQLFKIDFLHFECLNCHQNKPIFRQGFCQKCFFEIPQTADWIMHPELSKAHLGIEDRDLEYEKSIQLKPHIVYLANSGDVKVGVTRKSQIPTRWIDQGADQALIIAEMPNRYLAGIVEVALKQHVSDKTNWRKMLTNNVPTTNLKQIRDNLLPFIPLEAKPFCIEQAEETCLHFPVEHYPQKVSTLNLIKSRTYQGVLKGIKGQYLLFDDQTVFNIRANEGLFVRISIN